MPGRAYRRKFAAVPAPSRIIFRGAILRPSFSIPAFASTYPPDEAVRRRLIGTSHVVSEISGVGPAFCPIILCKLKTNCLGLGRNAGAPGADTKNKGLQ